MNNFEADLHSPPDQVPATPPVSTRLQVLPFGELTWENFERLCYRLATHAQNVEHVARYGRSGQKQQGIDIFARLATGKYETWQAKRYESIDASDVKEIVKTFREGTWRNRSERFILAVQASLADTKIQERIETEARALSADGITFIPRGGEELSEILKDYPEIVDDFFGRSWVEAFLGAEVAKALGPRLDGADFVRVRAQLARFYQAHFNLLDVGIALPPYAEKISDEQRFSLLRRFVMPDVLVRDVMADQEVTPNRADSDERANVPSDSSRASTVKNLQKPRRRDYVRRASLAGWLAEGTQLVIVGEPGSGKSNLLRCIALDLLSEQGTFPQSYRHWSRLLPIHVSFSKWSRLSSASDRAVGLKEVLSQTLQVTLTADLLSLLDRAIDEGRVLLLLDGLDEWADEQAARTTLQYILAFVATHAIPTVATARPRGLDKLGAIPAGWRTAELAALSADQQRAVADLWFTREVGRAATAEPGFDVQPLVEQRRDRFFAEVSRDRRIVALAGNPLLLIGLVALSIRQVALPRNRVQVVQSLVTLLIETHPQQRATAAGDMQPRFQHIPDAEERRAALARLAFIGRGTTGGGSFGLKAAKDTIRDYLADPKTLAYPLERARQAASELLAVNAETLGLLAERAPGELSFAHAAFEEHLAAEHIHTWPLPEIVAFIQDRCGESRWRNVISSLIAQLRRPSEVETLVSTMEKQPLGRVEAINRDVLLADIAFSTALKPPALAKRIVSHTCDMIERGDWMPARREILRAALAGGAELTSQADAPDSRLITWAPCREKYLSSLFAQLGMWRPSPDLLEFLFGALHDEERSIQRSAAQALSRVYNNDQATANRLTTMLQSTINPSLAAAALESLTLGWPETPRLSEMHDAAMMSREGCLQLVGIQGRADSGRTQSGERDALVGLLADRRELEYWDKPTARELLSKFWSDDFELIELALKSVSRSLPDSQLLERDSAIHYLVRCSPTNSKVVEWVKQELGKEFPFSLGDHGEWEHLSPFALAVPEIRTSIVDYIKSERGHHYLHFCQSLILDLRGDDLRDTLIEAARKATGFGIFWAVRPLVEGWGRSDPLVEQLLDEIPSWDNERINELAFIFPRILKDSAGCRKRLLSLVDGCDHPRFDLIARGLAELGCTGDDSEVVNILLSTVGRGAPAFDAATVLITHFSTNSRVRAYALDTLRHRSPPLAALAGVYEGDPEIRHQIFDCATALPTTLRGDIVEAVSGESQSPLPFSHLLEGYDCEVDSELKIASSIAYHRRLSRNGNIGVHEHISGLAKTLHAVGPDLSERRAAAFAGMLLLGRVGDIVPMHEYSDRPLHIRIGGGLRSVSDSLMSLVCERWDEVVGAFGATFASRFGDFGSDESQMWELLAPHINASLGARRDFLAFCNQTRAPIGLNTLLALAHEEPASQKLLDHCWRSFDREAGKSSPHESPWNTNKLRLEIAYILRDQFPHRSDVIDHVREAFIRHSYTAELVALTLLDPSDSRLRTIPHRPTEIAERFSDWVAATHFANVCIEVDEFINVLLRMINRESRRIWDFQDICNRAIADRLRRDVVAVQGVRDKLESNPTEHEIASLPRLLASAGVLDEDAHKTCRSLLGEEAKRVLPTAGYDAIEDAIRGVSESLLDVLAPSFFS